MSQAARGNNPMIASQPARSGWGVWLLAIRPATLTAAIAPVMVGCALAQRQGGFLLGPALAALAGALLLQVGVNLANDVDDFERGADTGARLGPTRVTQHGLLTAAAVRRTAWLAFGLAAVVGVYLIAVAGWPIAVIGIAAIIAGWAYTGGPWPLGYHGLGEVFVFIFFGMVAVLGTAFVQTGTVTPLAVAAALPVSALVTAILVVNNARDIESDAAVGKRTLAVRWGGKSMRDLYAWLIAVAYAAPLALWVTGRTSAWVLLPLLTLPLAARLATRMSRAQAGAEFNKLLHDTARLHLFHAALFAAGLLR
ncbi:MAG: 1,4-dihydroxy-2-naphthoate polyprenyltransferase [Candidatus Binatia bacterium]